MQKAVFFYERDIIVGMSADSSFVDVRRLGVDYSTKSGIFKKMVGQQSPSLSALRDVSFGLSLGAWAVVYGGSGSGKSTLLRVLAGARPATTGTVLVNGKNPQQISHLAVGYISTEEDEDSPDLVSAVLQTFASTHDVKNAPARIAQVVDALQLGTLLFRPAIGLSQTEKLRLNIARAALSDVPLILFDGTADELGVEYVKDIIAKLFTGRTGLIATRFPETAQKLSMPVLLLHQARLAHHGTVEDIATTVSCPRVVDVWLEGVRYDLLRQLRHHPGISEVRLVPTDQYSGQRLRLWLRSSHYLPSIYDLVSQANLIKIEELPPSLADVLEKL